MSKDGWSEVADALSEGREARREFEQSAANWWGEVGQHLEQKLGRSANVELEKLAIARSEITCRCRLGPIHFQKHPSVYVSVTLTLTPDSLNGIYVHGPIKGQVRSDVAADHLIAAIKQAARNRFFADTDGIRFKEADD